MRKLKLFAGASFLLFTLSTSAQQAYLIDEGVAVFYPKDYDAKQHLPSPIFIRELVPQGAVPTTWKLRPQYSVDGKQNVTSIPVGEGVDLYGTGEIFGNLRRNGETEGFWNKDNGAYGADHGKRLYQTHPWVLGVRKDGTAFGIIFDNTWKSKMTTDKVVSMVSEGPAFRTIIIERQTPQDVLKELAKLSGTFELPPLWSLGYQQCRFSYYPDTRVKEIANEFRNRQIPCDVIWMDIHYMQDYKIFTFNKERFPDPKGLNSYLHDKNFKSIYMIDPAPKAEEGYFVDDQLMANKYYVTDKDGNPYVGRVWPEKAHFPDFTRPEVRTWWAGLYKDFMAQGVDGIWNDMNEPSVFSGPDGSMPEDNIHLGGEGLAKGTHLRYHNQYGFNMVKASREGILAANPEKRPFVLSRSNFLGGQRYAATWTGDNYSNNEQMELSIPMTLNMGLTGQIMNGPDIGGFLGNGTPELLADWTAAGIYFPFTRNHSCDGTTNQEPWAMGQKVEDVCRTAINRRYRLLPYIYTLYREASLTGMPVMRPTFFADLKDLSLRDQQKTYMLGNDLLIIPRFAKGAILPKGDWDLISFEQKDDNYQAYVALRAGAIVPLANLYQNTVEYKTDSLTLLVNPDANGLAEGSMYEDAGNGFDYQRGIYAQYEFKAQVADDMLKVSLAQVDGKQQYAQKTLRIGLVVNGKVYYSPWTKSNSLTMKMVKDKQLVLDVKKLSLKQLEYKM